MKIVIFGNISPIAKIGGVTIHCDRLLERLSRCAQLAGAINISLRCYSLRTISEGLSMAARHILRGNAILHFHTSYRNLPFLLLSPIMYAVFSRAIISYHSGALLKRLNASYIDRCLFYYAACVAKKIIVMNELQRDSLKIEFPSIRYKFTAIHPFIMPSINEELKHVRPDVLGNEYVIGCMGSWLRHYGFHDLIFAVHSFAKRCLNLKIRIEFAIGMSQVDELYRAEIYQLIQNSTIENVTINIREDIRDQFKYFTELHAFVRPSFVDSFGLCVAESVLMLRPTIATDVCRRVNGVRLYKPGDLIMLENHLSDIWTDLSAGTMEEPGLDSEHDAFYRLSDVYTIVSREPVQFIL